MNVRMDVKRRRKKEGDHTRGSEAVKFKAGVVTVFCGVGLSIGRSNLVSVRLKRALR